MLKKCISAVLSATLMLSLGGCRDKGKKFDNGELVVIDDTSDINLGIAGYDTLNPIETSEETVRNIMNIIYEPLFSFDNKMNIVPVLAENYIMSDDGKRITVNLKKEVKWHDGLVFSSEDVIFTIGKILNSSGIYKDIAKKIAGYTATADTQVVIDLLEPSIDFAYYLTFPVLSKNTEYGTGDDFIPIGTGSYIFEEKNGGEMIFQPNREWHGGNQSKKRVVVKFLKNNETAIQAFNANEIDAVTSSEWENSGITLKSNSSSKKISSQNLVFLGFNTANENLPNKARKAINLLIDKQMIADKAAYGYGIVCDYAITPESWVYEALYSPKRSKKNIAKLFEQAGFEMENGVYQKNGENLNYTILVNDDNESRIVAANTIAENLKSYGIDAKAEAVSYNEYIDAIKNDDFDMFVGEIKTDDFLNPFEMLEQDNYFNLDASEFMNVLSELYGLEREKYISTVKKLSKKFIDSSPYAPLYFKTQSVFYGAYVSGITDPNVFDAYKDVEKWYYYNDENKEGEMTND